MMIKGMMKMRFGKLCAMGLIALAILLVLPTISLSKDSPAIVNIMIDVNYFANSTEDQRVLAHNSLTNLVNELGPKGRNATIYVPGYVAPIDRLYITSLGSQPAYEIAFAGMDQGEKLSSMSQDKQKSILEQSKKFVEACHICNGKTIEPRGFKPQSFDQNSDTYNILDAMGIAYDAGFEAGELSLPGHNNDTWPYLVENHRFFAVPVSTYDLSVKKIYLSDRYSKVEKGLSGTQWHDVLVSKFDESARNGEPMVVIFDNLISGKEPDYLDAYIKFLDYAAGKDAKFVTTLDLVNMSKTGVKASLAKVANESKPELPANKTICVVCDTLKNSSLNVSIGNATAKNETNAVKLDFVPTFAESAKK
jgi:hypothetical protein